MLFLSCFVMLSKGPIYRFPSNIDCPKCRREIAASWVCLLMPCGHLLGKS